MVPEASACVILHPGVTGRPNSVAASAASRVVGTQLCNAVPAPILAIGVVTSYGGDYGAGATDSLVSSLAGAVPAGDILYS